MCLFAQLFRQTTGKFPVGTHCLQRPGAQERPRIAASHPAGLHESVLIDFTQTLVNALYIRRESVKIMQKGIKLLTKGLIEGL